MRNARRALLYALAAAAVNAPAAVGALPPARLWPYYVLANALVLYAFARGSARPSKAVVVLVSAALTLSAADLALRFTYIVPPSTSGPWPPMPLLLRFLPDSEYEFEKFGDLSQMSGVMEWREPRNVRVTVDSRGFREGGYDPSRPVDVVLLGDSYGAGSVSHEDTWASVLARDYGRNVYNLSVPGHNPWQEYVTFWAEGGRLKTRPGAVLVWQFYTGNDLEGPFGPADTRSLVFSSRRGAVRTRYENWMGRSPVRLALERVWPVRDARHEVIARDFPGGRKMLFYRPYAAAASMSAEEVEAQPNFERLREAIGALGRLAAERGVRPVVVLVPTKEEVYSWVLKGGEPWTADDTPSGFAAAVSRVCEREGIKFLDLKAPLVAESRRAYEEAGRLLYWYDDTHMNAAGYHFTAAVIHRELLR